MTTAVSGPYQRTTDHRLCFLSGLHQLHAVKPKTASPKKKKSYSDMHFLYFSVTRCQLHDNPSWKMLALRYRIDFTHLKFDDHVVSDLSGCVWNRFRNQGCVHVHVSHPIKYHVILGLSLQHERISLNSDDEKLPLWHLLSDLISIHIKDKVCTFNFGSNSTWVNWVKIKTWAFYIS